MECEKQHFYKLRNRVINEIRKAKANIYVSILEKGKGNTNLMWENLRNLTVNYAKNPVRNIKLEFEGKRISDHAMIAITCINYFVDVISVLTKSICLDFPCIALMDGDLTKFTLKFTLKQVSNREVDSIISCLKNLTSEDKYGLDTIFYKTYK